jgi:arylformamidase
MKLYDISRSISPATAVWPGDEPFSSEWSMSLDRGDSVNVAAIHMSVHTATHADAPLHFLRDGESIDRVDLDKFVGPALVVEVGDVDFIGLEHVQDLDLQRDRRLLFKTSASSLPDDRWPESFAYLSEEAADYLGAKGVELVGMDTPSVDSFDSKSLSTHKILLEHQVVILENLVLRDVPAGRYELIALPLKLVGLDASPVRAVLRSG